MTKQKILPAIGRSKPVKGTGSKRPYETGTRRETMTKSISVRLTRAQCSALSDAVADCVMEGFSDEIIASKRRRNLGRKLERTQESRDNRCQQTGTTWISIMTRKAVARVLGLHKDVIHMIEIRALNKMRDGLGIPRRKIPTYLHHFFRPSSGTYRCGLCGGTDHNARGHR